MEWKELMLAGFTECRVLPSTTKDVIFSMRDILSTWRSNVSFGMFVQD